MTLQRGLPGRPRQALRGRGAQKAGKGEGMQSARAARGTASRRGGWCAVRVRTGREAATAEALRRALPSNVLTDAFVPRKERWFKRNGAWSLRTVPMYPGYFVAVTKDAETFARAAWKASLKVEPTGHLDGERRWIESNEDGGHIVRGSDGVIENGKLRVVAGPLVGQEDRILKVDRHKRACTVLMCCEDGRAVTELFALHVSEKR